MSDARDVFVSGFEIDMSPLLTGSRGKVGAEAGTVAPRVGTDKKDSPATPV